MAASLPILAGSCRAKSRHERQGPSTWLGTNGRLALAAQPGDRGLGGDFGGVAGALEDGPQGLAALVPRQAELVEPRLAGFLGGADGVTGLALDAIGDGAEQLALLARGREEGGQHRASGEATGQRQQRRILDPAGGLAAGAVIGVDRPLPRALVLLTVGPGTHDAFSVFDFFFFFLGSPDVMTPVSLPNNSMTGSRAMNRARAATAP